MWPPYEQVPTVKELGYDVMYESPNFSMGPPNMPKPVVEIWVKAIKVAVDNPEFKQFCLERGARWGYSPPDQLVEKLEKQRELMRTIMGKAGILKESLEVVGGKKLRMDIHERRLCSIGNRQVRRGPG